MKATLFGIQAAFKAPMKPGSRVLIMSSGAAMVMSVPFVAPYGLRLSGGSVGAERMQWFMVHSANAASVDRGLGITFQAILPMQLIGGTEFGRQIALAYARIEGVTPEQHILDTYGAHLLPDELGEHVADLLGDAQYAEGVAYGVRAGAGIVPLDS